MDLSVQEFIDGLLTKEALEQPSDTVKQEQLVMELPEWYNEEEYNKGRRFYWDNCFSFSLSMLFGLVAVFSVPSILRLLISTRRSNSEYTAYKRYLSTLLHTASWFEHELKPGSVSWKSLYAVRSRHLRASLAGRLQGAGKVSQRDMALTQFGFVGFAILKPEKFGVRQLRPGDWEAYNHFWRVIGSVLGLEDRYNIFRKNFDETREVCQILLERVYTPCLDNVPEYFEHTARVMLDGMWSVIPSTNTDTSLYLCRHLADVPGYIITESERMQLQSRLREQLKGKPLDTGVDSSSLISKPAVDGLPSRPPRLLYLRDYDTIETSPEYKRLGFFAKWKLNFDTTVMHLYTTYLGRLYFNLNYLWSLFLMKYFPFLAFAKFGVRAAYVNMFRDDPVDNTKPKPNSEYYNAVAPAPWYRSWVGKLW